MKVKEGRRRYPRKGGRDLGQNKTAGFKLAQAYMDFVGHKYTWASFYLSTIRNKHITFPGIYCKGGKT